MLRSRRSGTHNMLLCHPAGCSSAPRASSTGPRQLEQLGRVLQYDIIHVMRTAKWPATSTAPCLCCSTPPSMVGRKDGRVDAGAIKCYSSSTDGQPPTSHTASPAVCNAQAASKEAVRAVGALSCPGLCTASGVPRVLLADFPWSPRSLVRIPVALRSSLSSRLTICLQSLGLLLKDLSQRLFFAIAAFIDAPCYVAKLRDVSMRAGPISFSRMLICPLGGAAN